MKSSQSRYESQCQKTYLRKCAPSEDSDQRARSRSLISIITRRILGSQGFKFSSCGQQRLKRLHGCAGWFESSLGAHVKKYVFSRCSACNSLTRCRENKQTKLINDDITKIRLFEYTQNFTNRYENFQIKNLIFLFLLKTYIVGTR